MAKSTPAKVSVECPHCGFKQQEYAAAKSTMCRQCGRYFSPSAPRVEQRQVPSRQEAAAVVADIGASLRGKFEGLWTTKRNSVIECFDCRAKQEVAAAAPSTNCPKCGAHQDLRDYKITTSFSRSIRTHGEVHVQGRGDLSSTSVVCSSAVIEGKLRGNLQASGTVQIRASGKLPGRIVAQHLLVDRKAEVQFFRQLRCRSVEIRGHMVGDVVAETIVVIHRDASLDGNVTAKSISVEKGGMFSGQLVIGSVALKQAELLPQPPESAKSVDSDEPLLIATPLPAA